MRDGNVIPEDRGNLLTCSNACSTALSRHNEKLRSQNVIQQLQAQNVRIEEQQAWMMQRLMDLTQVITEQQKGISQETEERIVSNVTERVVNVVKQELSFFLLQTKSSGTAFSNPSAVSLTTKPVAPSMNSIEGSLEIKQASKGNENPAYNMVIGAALLQNNIPKAISELPNKALEYGLEMGKFGGLEHVARAVLDRLPVPLPTPSQKPTRAKIARNRATAKNATGAKDSFTTGNAKPLAGAPSELPPPNFDDLLF